MLCYQSLPGLAAYGQLAEHSLCCTTTTDHGTLDARRIAVVSGHKESIPKFHCLAQCQRWGHRWERIRDRVVTNELPVARVAAVEQR